KLEMIRPPNCGHGVRYKEHVVTLWPCTPCNADHFPCHMMSVDNDADESVAANCSANHARLTRGHWRHGIVEMGKAADAGFKPCFCLSGRAIDMACRNDYTHIDDLANGVAWHHFGRKREHHRHIGLAQNFQRFKRGCIHRTDKFDAM